jgi:O-antigen chain-terminating methyltransferase
MLEERFKFYLPYVTADPPVVDLGCGRGEFLGLLQEAGIDAVGVEFHGGQAEECRRRGLSVVQGDMFEYLTSVTDGSVGCAFSAQVIEHIPFDRLHALFRLCYRKLKPGGLVIAETVNPHCTAAFKFFWLDPTHIAPLFPETMQFLAESVGFRDVRIVYPQPGGDPQRLYHECGEYAIVGRKPPDDDPTGEPAGRE